MHLTYLKSYKLEFQKQQGSLRTQVMQQYQLAIYNLP